MANTGVLYYKLIQTDRIDSTGITTTTNSTELVSVPNGTAISVGDIMALNNYAGVVADKPTADTPDVTVNAQKNIAYRDPVSGDTAFWLDGDQELSVQILQKNKIAEFAQFGEWKTTYNTERRETVELLLPPYYDSALRKQLAVDLSNAPAMVLYDCDLEEYWKVTSTSRTITAVGSRSQPKLTLEIAL